MRALLAASALVCVTSCWDVPEADFTPQSYIEKLRILGVKAEPPEVAPGARTKLSALVSDPEGHQLSWVWLVCDPDPAAALGSACSRLDTARSAADLVKKPPPGVHVIAGPQTLSYTAPADAIEKLPASWPERVTGVTATFALLVFTGSDPQATDSIRALSIKRVKIHAVDANTNANPSVLQVFSTDALLEPTAITTFAPGATESFKANATPESAQKFSRLLPDGTTLEETEPLVFSWLMTAGRVNDASSRGDRTDADEWVIIDLPQVEQTKAGNFEFFTVLRDTRGGIDWTRRVLRVEP